MRLWIARRLFLLASRILAPHFGPYLPGDALQITYTLKFTDDGR
jgi:hypothetical protein